MNAIEVTYPAGWHFRGQMFLAGVRGGYFNTAVDDCGLTPTAVYRATSADGLSFAEQWPVASWGWASGPNADFVSGKNCFPLHGQVPAQMFVKYAAALMGVEYLGDVAPEAVESARLHKQADDANAQNAGRKPGDKSPLVQWTVEMASGLVGYRNGSFAIKGRLTVESYCREFTEWNVRPLGNEKGEPGTQVADRCLARVMYVAAPEDRLAAVEALWDRPGMGPKPLDEWLRARAARASGAIDRRNDPTGFIANEELLSWRGDLAHSDEMRLKMYEQFDGLLKTGLEKAQAEAAETARKPHTIPPDWVDYHLDLGLVNDRMDEKPGVSRMERRTWTADDGVGKFETWDVEADPNGRLAGKWTAVESWFEEREKDKSD